MSIVGIDSSVLLSLFQSRAGMTVTAYGSSGPAKVKQPTAPWSTEQTPAQTSALVKAAMARTFASSPFRIAKPELDSARTRVAFSSATASSVRKAV